MRTLPSIACSGEYDRLTGLTLRKRQLVDDGRVVRGEELDLDHAPRRRLAVRAWSHQA